MPQKHVDIMHINEAPWVREVEPQKGPRKLGAQVIGDLDEGLRAMIIALAPNKRATCTVIPRTRSSTSLKAA